MNKPFYSFTVNDQSLLYILYLIQVLICVRYQFLHPIFSLDTDTSNLSSSMKSRSEPIQ